MLGSLLRLTLLALFAGSGTTPQLRAADSHLERLGVPAWHARGITGKGITVAVLDNGFRGYRTHLGKLLPQVETQSFRGDGNLEAKDSIHGLLCAEVIHTIAPDARLLFANWEPDEPESFLKAVAWARERGARIISCSIVMPGWSDGLGGGEVHRELAKQIEGVLFFASAGNLARRHWSGTFRGDRSGHHLWKEGRVDNAVIPWGGQPVSVELVSRDASTYRLHVKDENGREAGTAQALRALSVRGSAVRFKPIEGECYRLKVELVSGPGGEFRLVVLGGELEYCTNAGCMVFPGDGRDVIAVGAVSSWHERSPTSAIGSVKGNVKPDCVAATPFPCRLRAAPFDGTSAAAPQGAGLAALLWSGEPKAEAPTIRRRLRDCCVDIGPAGPDAETGYGVIRLPSP